MVVYLIRHTSVDVPQGVCYGQTDVPLNPTFEEEAAQTSARLKGLQFDKLGLLLNRKIVHTAGKRLRNSRLCILANACAAIAIKGKRRQRVQGLPTNKTCSGKATSGVRRL